MRFWDTSAVVPLLLRQPATPAIESVFRDDPVPALWWGCAVECASALARESRLGDLTREQSLTALALLKVLREGAIEVRPSDEVRARSMRLLGIHPLRAADALQLAAALVWCRQRTGSAGFVSLDDRLRAAAEREGFDVLPRSDSRG